MTNFVNVALNINHNDGIFTYQSEDLPKIGTRVLVPFKNKEILGVVLEYINILDNNIKIKNIIKTIDKEPIITKNQIDLLKFCAKYYFNPLGPCVFLAISKNISLPKSVKIKENKNFHEINLTDDQKDIISKIKSNNSKKFLLQGVTGSGKTLIYTKLAQDILKENKSILFIVPEISLTPQLINNLQKYLPQKIAVLHSQVSLAQKKNIIFGLLNNEIKILVGARSAIFAPLNNLGLIVVDEEHDDSFKQNDTIRYNARDLALFRAQNENAIAVLGSATPSLESIYNAQNNKLIHLKLNTRYNKNFLLPKVEIIDLKEEKKLSSNNICIISNQLQKAILENSSLNHQTLLFLNRRGFAPFGICYDCGEMLKCDNCSVSLTYYQKKNFNLCHQCSRVYPFSKTCPSCQKESLKFVGLGTEKLLLEVQKIFPQLKALRLDKDEANTKKKLEETLEKMHEGKADILVGTKMISKGHDFEKVNLVGIILADLSLSLPDFRAQEKAFQLFCQVAGRAGRRGEESKCIIQTFNKEHISIRYAQAHDVDGFIKEELSQRKLLNLPPYSFCALLRLEHENEDLIKDTLENIKNYLDKFDKLNILGPSPSPIEKIKDRFRHQIMLLSENRKYLHDTILKLKNNQNFIKIINQKKIRFIIDIDPQSLM